MTFQTCECGFLEEIRGFASPEEYERFLKYIDEQINKGNLSKVDSDDDYQKGLIYGGQWYQCTSCNEIWRIVAPDFPFRGLWEQVEYNK